MKTIIIKAPATQVEANIFRRGDNLYVDIGGEQYVLSITEINNLEDINKRSTITS